jgi:hypothetical protein
MARRKFMISVELKKKIKIQQEYFLIGELSRRVAPPPKKISFQLGSRPFHENSWRQLKSRRNDHYYY